MTDLIELLEQFNRKERYFLIGQALGNETFRLSEDFRKKLGCELELEIPCDASAWMDYHLDSVAASLWRYRHRDHQMEKDFPKRDGMVTGTQQDIDLLIAFREKNCEFYYLVFIEAKGYESNYSDGYATWNTKEINEQMEKKACQLRSIFGSDERECSEVRLRFCLMSHHCPTNRLKTDNWPSWMMKAGSERPHWLKLHLPSDRLRVTRCNPGGQHSRNGDRFRIVDA